MIWRLAFLDKMTLATQPQTRARQAWFRPGKSRPFCNCLVRPPPVTERRGRTVCRCWAWMNASGNWPIRRRHSKPFRKIPWRSTKRWPINSRQKSAKRFCSACRNRLNCHATHRCRRMKMPRSRCGSTSRLLSATGNSGGLACRRIRFRHSTPLFHCRCCSRRRTGPTERICFWWEPSRPYQAISTREIGQKVRASSRRLLH